MASATQETKPLTDAEALILGLVAEQDRYGYQIDAEIEHRSMRTWASIGFSSIYHTLSMLRKQGLLRCRDGRHSKGPTRRVYSITAAGRKRLAHEVTRRLQETIPLPTSFYLGLALANHVDPNDALSALVSHRKEVETRLQAVASRRLALELPAIALDMLELGAALAQAEGKWLEGFIKKLPGARHEGQRKTDVSGNHTT